MDKKRIENAVVEILEAIGENPNREGLKDTPRRIADMYEEIFSGINADAEKHLETYFAEQNHEEIVVVKDIPFYSVCEHHFVPFFGKTHIAYMPEAGKLIGLSKLARLLDVLSKKPQLQERLCSEIVDAIMLKLESKGAIAIVEAEHMCMTMRGIKKLGSKTVTFTARGIFKENEKLRTEALSLIKN